MSDTRRSVLSTKLREKRGGPMGKTKKAERKREKQALLREWEDELVVDTTSSNNK